MSLPLGGAVILRGEGREGEGAGSKRSMVINNSIRALQTYVRPNKT